MKYKIICSKCGLEINREPVYKCHKCGGILKVRYILKRETYLAKKQPGIFKYEQLLPIKEIGRYITLGEGDTPLIKSNRLYEDRCFENLYFKYEGLNPTGSFKDRGIAVSMTKADELGINTIIIASSGNASASAAAYATKSGKRLITVVPQSTPNNKILQAVSYGSVVVKVPGNFSSSYKICKVIAEEHNWLNITTTFNNPYALEGYKTIGYEIFDQLKKVPDWIVIPVGAGPILAAIKQAFDELKEMNITKKMPRLVCVQAKNCGPISEAFLREGNQKLEACINAKNTIASGIDDSLNGYTEDGDFTIDCIRDSKGLAVLVSEKEILDSVFSLAKQGVYAEPAGGVGMIATRKLYNTGEIKGNHTVVIVVTGNGLKNPSPIKNAEPPIISSKEEFNDYLQKINNI